MQGLSGTIPLTTTSIREYSLLKTELLKLHSLKPELVNEILCQNQQERSSWVYSSYKFTECQQQFEEFKQQFPAAVKPRLHHRCRLTKAMRTAQKDKVSHGADMELEGLVMESEQDRLQRYSNCDFLMQVKQNSDTYFDRIFSNDHRKRGIVKELIQ